MASSASRNDVKNGGRKTLKPVVPALPLGFPQRPTKIGQEQPNQQTGSPPQTESPVAALPLQENVLPEPLAPVSEASHSSTQHDESTEVSTEDLSHGVKELNLGDTHVNALSNGHEHQEKTHTAAVPLEDDTARAAPEANVFLGLERSEPHEAAVSVHTVEEIEKALFTQATTDDKGSSTPFSSQAPESDDFKGTSHSSIPEVENEHHPKLHRKSEVAPEVLANGHGRDYSVHVNVNHKPNGSTAVQQPLPTVYEHLLFLVNSKQLCDTVVQVNQPEQMLQPSVHYVHAALLLRSERLAKVIHEMDPSMQARLINLYPARNVQPHAFEAALRFFYSDHILSADGLFPRRLSEDRRLKLHLFDYVMSYWIAGIELVLEPVKTRAFELLRSLVDWDLAELAIKEVTNLRAVVDTSSSASSLAALSSVANAIFQMVVQLFVEHLHLAQFKLDLEATPVALVPRFSQLEPNRTATNPALSSMVFGSLPSHTGTGFSPNATASNILLNLGFQDLSFVAQKLIQWHGDEAIRVLQEVVNERELRRAHVISNRTVFNKQRLSNSARWNEAGSREYIEDGQLKSERVGFLLPTTRTH